MSLRIAAFTGIRSDYDLMSGLYSRIHRDRGMTLGLIVSGAHLSESYGLTVREIEKDRLPILARVESLIDSDSKAARLKSASVLIQGCLPALNRFKPDLILFAGDREDAMAAALCGAYLGVPTAHFFGGDHATDGNVDNPVRHACSKLASFHFVIHPEHKRRLLRIGEPSGRITVVGSPALDRFAREPRLSKRDLLRKMGRPHWRDYALMIHHPILGRELDAGLDFENVLRALKDRGLKAFVSYPNTDPGSRRSIKVIARYAGDPDFVFYKNLDRRRFINLMRHASLMIGNSSAGLLEAPSLRLAAVNVGARQTGRLQAGNVVFCGQSVPRISAAIDRALSAAFQKRLRTIRSPYGDGRSVERAFRRLKSLDLGRYRFKKEDPLSS